MLEVLGVLATIIAVAGVVLNNRHRRSCFVLWLISNSLTLLIHLSVGVWSLAVRDALFLALAVEGWILWKRQ